MDDVKYKRIPPHTAGLMLAIAGLYDFFQFLLTGTALGVALTWTVAIVAYMHFWLWFKLRGVGFLDSIGGKKGLRFAIKRLLVFFPTFFAELIPIFDALPFLSVGTALVIIFTWAEDAIKEKTGEEVHINARSPKQAAQAVQNIASALLSSRRQQRNNQQNKALPTAGKEKFNLESFPETA